MPGPMLEQLPIALANLPPDPEATTAAAGTANQASRMDHTHPRLTATNTDSLDGNGLQTIVFTRSFDKAPSPVFTLIEDGDTAPVSFRVRSWTITAGKYTGCVVYGQRARALPTLGGILLIGPLITALAGFLPFVPAANASFASIMIASSQP